MDKLTIYTDGACIENPGPGGYAAIIDYEDHYQELSGGFSKTTNNRMELMAAIMALESLHENYHVTIFSDSRYLVNAMSKGWAKHWQKWGWKRNKRQMAQNPDLWERLLKVCERHDVEFKWIQGHGSNSENNRCDQLATEAASLPHLPKDPGYENPPHRLF
jgi:ribonuclease HI